MADTAESLDAEIAERREELAGLMRELAAARSTARTLVTHAEAIMENARTDTKALVEEAAALAETIIADAHKRPTHG